MLFYSSNVSRCHQLDCWPYPGNTVWTQHYPHALGISVPLLICCVVLAGGCSLLSSVSDQSDVAV